MSAASTETPDQAPAFNFACAPILISPGRIARCFEANRELLPAEVEAALRKSETETGAAGKSAGSQKNALTRLWQRLLRFFGRSRTPPPEEPPSAADSGGLLGSLRADEW